MKVISRKLLTKYISLSMVGISTFEVVQIMMNMKETIVLAILVTESVKQKQL